MIKLLNKINLVFFFALLLFLLTGALAAWLYQLSQVDYQEHSSHAELVRNVEKNTTELTKEIFLVQYQYISHFDRVIKRQQQLEFYISQLPHTEITANLAEVWEAYKVAIEMVKSDYALYHNSLVYFPKGIDYLYQQFKNNKKHSKFVLNLISLERKVFQFAISDYHENQMILVDELEQYKRSIETLPQDSQYSARVLSKHVELILSKHLSLEKLREQLLNTQIPVYTQETLNFYNKTFQKKVNQSRKVKQLFYIVCIILILIVVISLAKLRLMLFKLENSE